MVKIFSSYLKRLKLPESFFNPFFTAAVLCAILIYSGVFPCKNKSALQSLINVNEVHSVDGHVCSNPVKTEFKNGYYKTEIAASKIYGSNNSFSSASGTITAYFPPEIIESNYPGKIYFKKLESSVLIENGAVISIQVKKINQSNTDFSYLVTDVKQFGWFGNFFQAYFYKFRALCRITFKRILYEWNEGGGFLLSLLSGSKEYSDPELMKNFVNAGLAHVIALSGMHLSIFGGIGLMIGKSVKTKFIETSLKLFFVLFFVWFVGISPSLFRAFLSSFIMFLISLFRIRKPDSLSLLSLVFILHVLIYPEHVKLLSFELSYGALTGILVFSNLVIKKLPYLIPLKLRKSLGQSISANFFTAPVVFNAFGKLMPVGIISSVIISPIIFVFLYTGFIGLILCMILPFLSGPINVIISYEYNLMKSFVNFFSKLS